MVDGGEFFWFMIIVATVLVLVVVFLQLLQLTSYISHVVNFCNVVFFFCVRVIPFSSFERENTWFWRFQYFINYIHVMFSFTESHQRE